ncbi:MAG: protein-L-isoaspartate(D-aspartate) O-methyltransferase [Bacteroidales bacterium]|jgi:protein-L-isoaspartate(D-aspartate) O-methyltransferase|nr:protein-L-isoaspartate(D-aspartate) O-methyltransferase [Bacteroidales bacterium]MDD2322129.1 protein-L-isoaspartate(D-aspartate) O-methyltransferase [Bacteroidales bacterium]MDD3961399.1 protein-L-isoaspartate(D-aspartate) O-methyltransferase [Bacteroidales bacterium]MDY0284865.1 protein-L-isoaspartate(D-aspartate) O-methyltransferase [Bacteroidales bacterium]HPE86788.1 protein-L-isoaspartate(D-aspartate) O-methyltransferase [Bacteroidales bacterium]
MIEDNFRHKGLRKKLAKTVAAKGIHSEMVLKAIEEVPRHAFFNSSFLEFAYDDKPFPIGCGQTISQPYTVAFQSELLQVEKGIKVLEIGTGSGYQACILAHMGAKVFTIERHRNLYLKAKKSIHELGYRIQCFYGDGFEGLPTFAPFQRIIVTAAAPHIPQTLVDQLAPEGIIVIPVEAGGYQIMQTLKKMNDGTLHSENHGHFKFVPMLSDKDNNVKS